MQVNTAKELVRLRIALFIGALIVACFMVADFLSVAKRFASSLPLRPSIYSNTDYSYRYSTFIFGVTFLTIEPIYLPLFWWH